MSINDDIDSLAFELKPPTRILAASSMKKWLKQYKVNSRSSTVTNAFVAALLPHDDYRKPDVEQAMKDLGQNCGNLTCVYCKAPANTWDHLINLVQDRKANGNGHRIRNLVPCCSACNSSKGGIGFEEWINGYTDLKERKIKPASRVKGDRRKLVKLLKNYVKKCPRRSAIDIELEAQLMVLRDAVLDILKQADKLVAESRSSTTTKVSKPSPKPSRKVADTRPKIKISRT